MSNKAHLKSITLFLGCVLFFIACNKPQVPISHTPDRSKVIVPDTVLVDNPLIVATDTCPPPVKTTLVDVTQNKRGVIQNTHGSGFFTNYTTDAGLALDAVACGMMDNDGNLWFGTNGGGVSRFNGKYFTNFNTLHGLSNNGIREMLQDKSGNIWFGTDGSGIDCYNGSAFINYSDKEGLATNGIWAIEEDNNGDIWFGTNGYGVSCYHKNIPEGQKSRFTNYSKADGLAGDVVFSIYKDKKGNLWFGTDKGLSFCSATSITSGRINIINYSKYKGALNNEILSITEDSKGNLWLGTDAAGIVRYNGHSFVSFYSSVQGLKGQEILCITEDKDGNIWFGTNSQGLYRYDGKKFINYTTAHGLPNNEVVSILLDKADNLWFATNGGGVSRYEGGAFINYTTQHGLSHNIIWSMVGDNKGRLWLGTDGGGLNMYDGNTFVTYLTANDKTDNVVKGLMMGKDGSLWFGTNRQGICWYDGNTVTQYSIKQGLPADNINSMMQDKYGNIWIGTSGGGISRYDGKKFTSYNSKQGLANDMVWTITEDEDSVVWIGTDATTLTRFDWKHRADGKALFTNYNLSTNLSNNSVSSIVKDMYGNIWIGVFGDGVYRYDGKTFLNFTVTEGLPDNGVSQIIIDSANRMFIGTNMGIAVCTDFVDTHNDRNRISLQNSLSNKELSAYTLQTDIYNSQTGYPVKDINVGQNSMYKDADGVVWLATGADKTGLVRFDPSAVNKHYVPPVVCIQGLKINNDNICWNDIKDPAEFRDNKTDESIKSRVLEEVSIFGKPLSEEQRLEMRTDYSGIRFDSLSKWYFIPRNLVLPYKYNNVTFDFFAIETSRNAHVRYQYYLEGYDKDWNPVTDKTTATYGNIQYGTYTFKLRAVNVHGVWSDVVTYTFKVLPPWYRSWLAYGTYLAVIITLLYLLFRWRTASFRKDNERLEQTVRERTLELERKTEEIEEQKKLIEKKNEKITDSINYAKHIQESLLQSEDEIAKHLPEFFIYYRPKDIVSGDFYWFTQHQDKTIIAVADCTGHGVPGAFMSMIGTILLNEIVNDLNYTNPGTILDELHKRVYASLQQDVAVNTVQDGMDIAVCVINKKEKTFEFAGAQHSLYIVSNNQLQIIKADIRSIGGGMKYLKKGKEKGFETHHIPINQAMTIYMFSDGYTDQFGGHEKRKFGSGLLKELLLSITNQPLNMQKELLHQNIEKWKGDVQQTDDILVVGLKIGDSI